MDIYGIKTQGFDIKCVWLLSQSCPVLSKSVDCSAPVFPVLHYLPKSAQTHVHLVSNAIQSSHPVAPFSCPQSFPVSGSFLITWLFFPNSSPSKESTCNAGDLGSVPWLGRYPEKGMDTHFSILAWRILWTVQSMGHKERGMT